LNDFDENLYKVVESYKGIGGD